MWSTSGDSDIEDGKLIVKAVNHHDELVDTLQEMFDAFNGNEIIETFVGGQRTRACQQASALLAKLEGDK